MEIIKNYPWKDQKKGFSEALGYIQGRRDGTINSIKTPWIKFNDATINGLEWNTINIICGRPGSLKTLVKSQIIKSAFILNPIEVFRVLEFQLEMTARTSAVREFSSVVNKSYKQLCSANEKLSQEDINNCYQYAITRKHIPIDVVEIAPTVVEFELIIDKYMELYHFYSDVKHINKDTKEESFISTKYYTKTIITLDHTILIKKGIGEKDKQDTLHKLGECLTKLKKKYPVIFIILSQLNRNIDNPDRCEEGKYGNLINEADVFGSDAMLMHADFLIALDRPSKRKIRIYGPDRYIIEDDSIIAMSFLKCRNGEPVMSFFKAVFEKMEIIEIAPPPQQQRRISTI